MKRVLMILVALVGCKNDASPGPAPSASGSASTIASVAATPSASAAPSGPTTYAGSYTATLGVLYVPDAAVWDGVKFRGDDGGAGALGEGKINIVVGANAPTIVSGDVDGPLGPALITGYVHDQSISFHVAPREPNDLAFSGTGTGTIEANKITGELHVSSWRANVLRDATFAVTRK